VADPWATITWPGAEVACGLSLSLADCTFMLENRDSCIFERLDCFLALWPAVRAALWVDAESGWLHLTRFHVLLEGIFITPDRPTLWTGTAASCPQSTCFGTRSSGIRMTWPGWPAHRSCPLSRNASIPVLPQICSNVCIGEPVLPLYSRYLMQATQMKLIEPADISSVECPGFTTIEQCSQHYSLIHGNVRYTAS